ncbi:hypothetical protein U0035_12465 [Niabella yanshanensis]|uniref:Uncharacterized protein n=1 Tax=Niabella yanshanensis TaxID=577386 RepID=A0ABZ0W305_9BACT|nr:hypothetical protein [Niabella yanshanensis]WQD36480.1 hypothetical protein U0035_12465 [Niabella yanshanensis]
MRRTLFISSMVILTGMVKAQNNISNALLKWNVTSAIEVSSFPALQFAVERSISTHYSITAEAGIQAFDLLKRSTVTVIQPKGLRANIVLRRYFLHRTGRRTRAAYRVIYRD